MGLVCRIELDQQVIEELCLWDEVDALPGMLSELIGNYITSIADGSILLFSISDLDCTNSRIASLVGDALSKESSKLQTKQIELNPNPAINDLKIYTQSEDDQQMIVDALSDLFPSSKLSTWDPDPVDTGSWGIFADEIPLIAWDILIDWFGPGGDLDGTLGLYVLDANIGEKEYQS
jgi:hypothetical protein